MTAKSWGTVYWYLDVSSRPSYIPQKPPQNHPQNRNAKGTTWILNLPQRHNLKGKLLTLSDLYRYSPPSSRSAYPRYVVCVKPATKLVFSFGAHTRHLGGKNLSTRFPKSAKNALVEASKTNYFTHWHRTICCPWKKLFFLLVSW